MTIAQQKKFWGLFAAACREQGLTDRAEMESYRKQVMMEECGVEHLADISNGDGFERVMARLAEEAGDYEAAVGYSGGTGRRYAAMIEDCCEQIFQLRMESGASTADYIDGILRQSGLAGAMSCRQDGWEMDLPADSLRDVFFMLDTHRRRVLRQLASGYAIPLPLTYRFGRTWFFSGGQWFYGDSAGSERHSFSVHVAA